MTLSCAAFNINTLFYEKWNDPGRQQILFNNIPLIQLLGLSNPRTISFFLSNFFFYFFYFFYKFGFALKLIIVEKNEYNKITIYISKKIL